MKLLIAILCAAASAQPAIDTPPLAVVRDADGRLTPIYGLAGNFIAGTPGRELLAYSNDGEIEWGLEPGRLFAVRDGVTASLAVPAATAVFRGDTAYLPETNELWQWSNGELVPLASAPPSRIAGREITWREGRLFVRQADGTTEEAECPEEPAELTAAAADWVHVSRRDGAYLLRVRAGRVALFVLPGRNRP